MCGAPASGKTSRALALAAHLRDAEGATVHLVDEASCQLEKAAGYRDSTAEKITRASLKASVERLLNAQHVVIVDSLNYIKGYRYELYCIARSVGTTHCVVFCEKAPEQAAADNAAREGGFEPSVAAELQARFEEPRETQRWDSPLFTLLRESALPAAAVADALLRGKKLQPNMATASAAPRATDLLYELDRITKAVENSLVPQLGSAMAV